ALARTPAAGCATVPEQTRRMEFLDAWTGLGRVKNSIFQGRQRARVRVGAYRDSRRPVVREWVRDRSHRHDERDQEYKRRPYDRRHKSAPGSDTDRRRWNDHHEYNARATEPHDENRKRSDR